MREKIREAFDSVHAEPELKAAARQAVARRAARRHRPIRRLGIALAAAACAVVLAGGLAVCHPYGADQHRYQPFVGTGDQPV